MNKKNQLVSRAKIQAKRKLKKSKIKALHAKKILYNSIETKILQQAIKNAEQANLEEGYIDFQQHVSLAEEDVHNCYIVERETNYSCLKDKTMLTNIEDDLESYRVAKAIHLLKKGIKK